MLYTTTLCWHVNNQGKRNIKNRTFRLQKLQVWLYFMIRMDANIVLSIGLQVMLRSWQTFTRNLHGKTYTVKREETSSVYWSQLEVLLIFMLQICWRKIQIGDHRGLSRSVSEHQYTAPNVHLEGSSKAPLCQRPKSGICLGYEEKVAKTKCWGNVSVRWVADIVVHSLPFFWFGSPSPYPNKQ